MNQPELSPGLLSVLPSFIDPLSQPNGAVAPDGNVFSRLLADASAMEESASSLLSKEQSLPLDGQSLPLRAAIDQQAQTLVDHPALEPKVLVERIRESLSFRYEQSLSLAESVDDEKFDAALSRKMNPVEAINNEAVVLAAAPLAQPVDAAMKPAGSAMNGMPATGGEKASFFAHGVGENPMTEAKLSTETNTGITADSDELVTQIRDASIQPDVNDRAPESAVKSQFNEMMTMTAVPFHRPDSGPALSAPAESLITEAELQQLEEQQQITDNRERLEFGRDKEQWTPALSNRLVTMVMDNIQQAEIHLDPPELGSMEIKLQVSQEQTSVQVQVQNPLVRDVLEANAQRLREALEQQGMTLTGFDVSQQDQQHANSGERHEMNWTPDDDVQDSTTNPDSAAGVGVAPPISVNSLLDAYA